MASKFSNYNFVRSVSKWVGKRKICDDPPMPLKQALDATYTAPRYRKYLADRQDQQKWIKRYWEYFHEELEAQGVKEKHDV